MIKVVLAIAMALMGHGGAMAELVPAMIFADHMMLQRDQRVPVWGQAEPGATVTVSFADQSVEVKADDKGRWQAMLEAMPASAEGREVVIASGDQRVTFKDVLVGDVWLASGQSNMAYTVTAMAGQLPVAKAMADAANLPAIRLRRVGEKHAPEPREDLTRREAWDVCSPESVQRHSAVGFVFARRLHEDLGVPVAVVETASGGTPIEAYVPVQAFVDHPTLEKLAALAKAGDIEGIKGMRGGTNVRKTSWLPGAIYNGRMAPIKPFGIRGAIWYQGESNAGQGEDPRDYEQKMRALVRGWRSVWGRNDLPVYFVQLPQHGSYAWPYLREEQRRASDEPGTGMVVTCDLEVNNIHPPNKIDVGERLARWALANVYGRDVVFSGPTVREVRFDSGRGVVTFDHAHDGLAVGHMAEVGTFAKDPSRPLQGFELAGEDGVWREATAAIDGETVVVTSAAVSAPVAVRYACRPKAPRNQKWNLYNGAGLPASPFCSDWQRMEYDR
jgi:sialate O-acetylesterase